MNSDRTGDAFGKSKWNWRTPSCDRAVVERSLHNGNNWSNGHMYRTSYHDMSDKVRSNFITWINRFYRKIKEDYEWNFIKTVTFNWYIFIMYSHQFLLSNTQFLSMQVSFLEKTAIQNWADPTPKSQEDASWKRIISKTLITDSKVKSKC